MNISKYTVADTMKNDVLAKNAGLATILWFIIVGSLIIHIIIVVVAQTVLSDWLWTGLSVHTSLEISGAITALFVAMFLLRYERFGRGTKFNIRIAAALIGMGVLDGFHAVIVVGNAFVWLHSMATFLGGLLFAFILVPSKWCIFDANRWPYIVMVGSIFIGIFALFYPELLPMMVVQGEFTNFAVFLNVSGGLLLFISAIKLIATYQRYKNTDDLLFCLHCMLFGAAAIMFQQSMLWDVSWWGWHILRFLAYAVALWFVVRGEGQILNELEAHRLRLTELVAERTRKYQQSEAQLKDAQRVAHLGSWRKDIESGKMEWSDELFRILGFEPESVPPTLETFRMVLGDEGNRFLGEYDETIMCDGSMQQVCRITCLSGEVRYLRVSAVINYDEKKRPFEIVGIALDITEQREKEAQIEHLANHDALTDLPGLRLSREIMKAELARSKRSKTIFAVMFIDLDGFKQINDTLGHDIGDSLLQEVAKRLTSCLRDCDMIARVGGDEFLVLQTDVRNSAAVASVAQKLVNNIAKPYEIRGHVIQIGASIGISLYPEHGDTTISLMKKADQAMYRVKKDGKNSFEFASL